MVTCRVNFELPGNDESFITQLFEAQVSQLNFGKCGIKVARLLRCFEMLKCFEKLETRFYFSRLSTCDSDIYKSDL